MEPPNFPRFSLVYEIRGKILHFSAIPKDKVTNPLCIFVMDEFIAPKIRELDPTCGLDRPLVGPAIRLYLGYANITQLEDPFFVTAPSEELRESLNSIDLQLGSIRTVANRVDKAEDKKRKRNVEQDPEEGQGGKQNKRNTPANSESEGDEEEEFATDEEEESVVDGEEAFTADGLRDGYKFLAKSLGLLVGKGPKGNQVIAKKVQAKSTELKIYVALRRAYRHEDFILPILKKFDFPPQGPTAVTYLIFPRWIPLSEIGHLALNAGQIVTLCSRLASGVEFLHTHLVAHLDLKPDNLVIQRNGGEVELRIIDFSVSVMLTGRSDLCSTHQGTPGFMAPEVFACEEYKESTADTTDIRYSPLKVDLFSCGRVFLYLVWWLVNTPEYTRVLR
ncbi:hypothetical protein D9757_003604 [Collybiopsis confluens]|uniref:Protein kinase domain-containing protein n=1 Tax=Collybiopsis confluens TaxID=2823264 RepID=A0A8H5HUX1_9AGAR|nr:hypothetical protein D9757_003604 [Collybiopsis confluens]